MRHLWKFLVLSLLVLASVGSAVADEPKPQQVSAEVEGLR